MPLERLALKVLVLSTIITILLLIGCADNQIPPIKTVNDLLETLNASDRPMGLAIIAATPPRPGPRDPFSISEVQQSKEQAEKELAFLESLTSVHILELAKEKANSFLKKPSRQNSKELRKTVKRFIKELERDINSQLWRELVPIAATQPIIVLLNKLKNQVLTL